MTSGSRKILLVGDHPPPHGGVAVHVEMLRRAVLDAGGECAVLDIGKGQVPAEGVYPAGGYPSFAAQLASFAARGYLVHVHTSGANPKSLMLAAACAAVGRLAGRQTMITLHSGLLPEWLDGSAARRVAAAAVLSGFGTVVAVSDQIAATLRACGVADEQMVVLPAFSTTFVEPGELPAAAAEVRAAGSPMLCAMLAHGRVYGADVLLQAFAKVREDRPGARLVVFGPSTRPHELPSAPGVLGLGELQRPQALAVMAASDLFVRPTLADGDSVSVREALALGKPVVATQVGTRPPGTRLVQAGSVTALADGILRALDDLEDGAAIPRVAETDLLRVLLPRYGLSPRAAVRAA